jgi:hypothetical protein
VEIPLSEPLLLEEVEVEVHLIHTPLPIGMVDPADHREVLVEMAAPLRL